MSSGSHRLTMGVDVTQHAGPSLHDQPAIPPTAEKSTQVEVAYPHAH